MTIRTFAPLALAAALAFTGCSKERLCAGDEEVCSETCIALRSDPSNCGACGRGCGTNQVCSAGACIDCTSSNPACVVAVVAACSKLDQVRPLADLGTGLAPATKPLPTDSAPIAFARISDKLYVANSLSNSISTVTLSPPSSTSGGAAISIPVGSVGFADLEYLAAHRGLLWASNAATGTLVAIDPTSGSVVDEIALGSATEFLNPQGLAFVGDKGYLALQGVNALAVLDVSSVPGAAVLRRIDLSALAAPGANAAPSRVVAEGSRVYVTLNDLFDASYAPVAGAYGRLAVVDATNDSLVGGAVDLGSSCRDPSALALSGTTLWIACGYFDIKAEVASGAALVPVELASGTPVPGDALVVPHSVMSLAFCNGRGYAGASDSGAVLAFDPATRAFTSTLVCPAPIGKPSFVPDLACAF